MESAKKEPKARGKSKSKAKPKNVCNWCGKGEDECECPDVCPGCQAKKGEECKCK